MNDLGVSRKELYEADDTIGIDGVDEDVKIYPTLYLETKHAQIVGLDQLEPGKEYEAKIVMKVKRKQYEETDTGKKSESGTIEVMKISDIEIDEQGSAKTESDLQ